jgi:hypothetical protein
MNPKESFSNSSCDDQMHLAEREFSAFIGAVTELSCPEQARLSADDWLDEAELMDRAPQTTSRAWRAVTIAASARLANRLPVALRHRASSGTTLVASTDAKLSPTPPSDCYSPPF